jgi:hypothetical protein
MSTSSIYTPPPDPPHLPPIIREPLPDEDAAMVMFVIHAHHCVQCFDPLSTGELCDLGNLFAWELAKYLYTKYGVTYSVLDRWQTGQRVEIEVPGDCKVIERLFEAVEGGMVMGVWSLSHGGSVLG